MQRIRFRCGNFIQLPMKGFSQCFFLLNNSRFLNERDKVTNSEFFLGLTFFQKSILCILFTILVYWPYSNSVKRTLKSLRIGIFIFLRLYSWNQNFISGASRPRKIFKFLVSVSYLSIITCHEDKIVASFRTDALSRKLLQEKIHETSCAPEILFKKQSCWPAASLSPANLLIKRLLNRCFFLSQFCESFKNTFFYRTSWGDCFRWEIIFFQTNIALK